MSASRVESNGLYGAKADEEVGMRSDFAARSRSPVNFCRTWITPERRYATMTREPGGSRLMKSPTPLISLLADVTRSSWMRTASVMGERPAPRVERISWRSPSSKTCRASR